MSRIQTVQQLGMFVFLGLIALNVDQYPVLRFLPVSLGNHLELERLTAGTLPSPVDLLIVFGVTAVYFAMGTAVFRWCEKIARARGILGQY